jgi:Transcriptional regulator PadR-like family
VTCPPPIRSGVRRGFMGSQTPRHLCVANTPAAVRITRHVCASRRSTRRTSHGFDGADCVIGGRGSFLRICGRRHPEGFDTFSPAIAEDRIGGFKRPGTLRVAQVAADAELIILSIVEARARHGYEISKLIETRSAGQLKFHVASLYPLLYRLEERGWLQGRWVETLKRLFC